MLDSFTQNYKTTAVKRFEYLSGWLVDEKTSLVDMRLADLAFEMADLNIIGSQSAFLNGERSINSA